jgi:hypothetical protein
LTGAVGVLARARAAAAFARASGCGIDEATDAVAAGSCPAGEWLRAGTGHDFPVSRRSVLGGAGAVVLAAAVPSGVRRRPAAADAGRR